MHPLVLEEGSLKTFVIMEDCSVTTGMVFFLAFLSNVYAESYAEKPIKLIKDIV